MKLASLVERIGGRGAEAWRIHHEAELRAARGEDVIMLSVGDPDFATPSPIVEAAVSALRAGDTHYTERVGRKPLRERIAALHSRWHGHAVAPEQVVVVAGAQNALFCAAQCLCEEGDEVLAPEPMYVTYEATVRATGATLRAIPVRAGSAFRIDLDALAGAITPRTRAIFFATPCNPTGVMMDEVELRAIADLAIRHDLWVVADEVYASLAFDAPHRSIAALPGMAQRTVTVSSLSKSHAMAGWRCGWMVAPTTLAPHLGNLVLCMLYGAPGFIQQAACTALDSYDEVTHAMREEYRRRLICAHSYLHDVPGLRCLRPQAGMFMLLDVRDTGMDAHAFAWELLRSTGVSVLDGSAFGPSTEGFVRLGFVVEEPRLAEACRRIRHFVQGLQRSA